MTIAEDNGVLELISIFSLWPHCKVHFKEDFPEEYPFHHEKGVLNTQTKRKTNIMGNVLYISSQILHKKVHKTKCQKVQWWF